MSAYTARRANCAMGAYPVYHQLSENHPVLCSVNRPMGDRLMCATARRDLDAVARIILRDHVAVDSKNAYGLTAFMQVSPSFQVHDIQRHGSDSVRFRPPRAMH